MDGFSDAMHGIIQESIIFEKLIYFLEHRRNSVSKLEKSGNWNFYNNIFWSGGFMVFLAKSLGRSQILQNVIHFIVFFSSQLILLQVGASEWTSSRG